MRIDLFIAINLTNILQNLNKNLGKMRNVNIDNSWYIVSGMRSSLFGYVPENSIRNDSKPRDKMTCFATISTRYLKSIITKTLR